MSNNKKQITREFGLSSLSVNNSTSVFIITAIIIVFGLMAYIAMPKEQYPEIKLPTIYVNTVYPGNSPMDIENLITRPLEKEIKSVKGIDKINSSSVQDVSAVIIQFNEDVEVAKALQDVKDAVDKAKKDLPNDLDNDPSVREMDFSEIPIVFINISGDFEISKLNKYAEYLEDEIEALSEVTRVDITGSIDREIQINADLFKMEAMQITFDDIEKAIANENLTMSGGDVLTKGHRRSIRISGEYQNIDEIKNTIVKAENQEPIYLKDVADVVDSYVERKSYSRLATNEFSEEGNHPVVSLKVIKKTGENLIHASEKIVQLLDDAKGNTLPDNLSIILTQNQADDMKSQISNLENSIISGVILVVAVLLFFMGLRNALFVGIAIPLSMFMAFMILSSFGITINIVVLFSLILALGMLVDNGIVVIENIYRLREEGLAPMQAAKEGVGEVAVAIISSTGTTLAAFVPLAFWGGIMGEFMKYMPITLIIVLASSLFVGLVINPVVAAAFMKVDTGKTQKNQKILAILGFILVAIAIPCYFTFPTYSFANILMLLGLITLSNAFILKPSAYWFQNVLLSAVEKAYLKILRFALTGKKPIIFFFGTIVFLVATIGVFSTNIPSVILFPENEPHNTFIYVEAPLGTDVETTDSIARELEGRIYNYLKPYKHIIKSVVSNVGENTQDEENQGGGGSNVTPHKSKIAISYVDYDKRQGINTGTIMKGLGDLLKDTPGLIIRTGKEAGGPPTGKPINIEVTGEDYEILIHEAEQIKAIIDAENIAGVDGLSLDVETGKPEITINIDRAKARRYGLSTGMIASSIRTALYGKEVSKYKDGEDDYPIQLRLADEYRYDIQRLNDQRIFFRDNKGNKHHVPISAVASLEYSSTFGSVQRKDLNRMIVVSSNITEGYNGNEIVATIKGLLSNHKMQEGYSFKFTGEQEEQAKSMAFLMRAMAIAVSAIFLILVSQFNSAVKPFIIVASVVFSLIGVFLGMTINRDEFVIIMTGVGIISLAGVVVNNAIVLIDYIDLTRDRKREELGIPTDGHLPTKEFIECLVEGGYTRLRPVLLTAITTVLGLIPLAIGLNIDFFGLFAHFEPNIYIGGDNAVMWGPMAWTVIYGLTFATFLTLVIIPVMYLISDYIASFTRSFKKTVDV